MILFGPFARARYRFNKKVVVSGVPGCVSNDLIAAADINDPVFEDGWTPIVREPVTNGKQYQSIDTSEFPNLQQAEIKLLKLIEYLDRTRPYLTFLFVKTHALAPSNQVELTPMQVDMILTGFKERQILVEEIRDMDGRTLRLLHFRREHPEVQMALAVPSTTPGSTPDSSFAPVTESTTVVIVDQEFSPVSDDPDET